MCLGEIVAYRNDAQGATIIDGGRVLLDLQEESYALCPKGYCTLRALRGSLIEASLRRDSPRVY
jgi:hypothetical protein